MYVATMLGVTVGFHRLFTHRSSEAVKPVQFVLGMFGSMTFQGPLLEWVGRHRIHHLYSDQTGDPHSPTRPYRSNEESRNNPIVGVLAMGEGWHNNHHAFPTSARQGLRWWQLDFGYYLICVLAWLGFTWNVRVPTAEAKSSRSAASYQVSDRAP